MSLGTLRSRHALVAGRLAGGCKPLTLFDALVLKDRGGMRVVVGVLYGPDPRQRLDE